MPKGDGSVRHRISPIGRRERRGPRRCRRLDPLTPVVEDSLDFIDIGELTGDFFFIEVVPGFDLALVEPQQGAVPPGERSVAAEGERAIEAEPRHIHPVGGRAVSLRPAWWQ